MSSPGASYKDFLPLPDNVDVVTDPDQETSATTLADEATDSHTLAVADHDEKGLAQHAHNAEVKDLGWNEPNEKIPSPLVGRLPNDELWVLIRRFNKVST